MGIINMKFLPLKAHYFFFMAAMGPILPFLPVIGKQLGISELIMGLINSVLPLLFLIAKPFFGFLIDYFKNRRKSIFIGLLAATSLLYTLMIFIPRSEVSFSEEFECAALRSCSVNETSSRLRKCVLTCGQITEKVNFYEAAVCLKDYNHTCPDEHVSCLLNCRSDTFYSSLTFWSFVLLMSLGTIGFNVSNSISDTICFDVLGDGNQMSYGRQRVWGTIGFGLTALIGGILINYLSDNDNHQDFTPAFLLALLCMGVDILCCIKLPLPLLPKPESILKEVYQLVKMPHVFTFLIFATIQGICDSSVIFYLLWYLEDLGEATGQLENIKLLEGLTVAVETLFGEVLFFQIGGKILGRVGYGHCLSLCFCFYALRLGLISMLKSPWWILPVELFMQGPTYALGYTTIVAYASAVSPRGTSGTVQGIVASMDDGLGYSLGSLLGGIIYKEFGGSAMFFSFSCLALFAACLHSFLYVKYFRHCVDKPSTTINSYAVTKTRNEVTLLNHKGYSSTEKTDLYS